MNAATLTDAQIQNLIKLENTDWNVWNPNSYLETYFKRLGPDSIENLNFLIKELKNTQDSEIDRVLDFGSGPTIFSGLVAASFAKEIHFADYLISNLFQIKKWLENQADAFNWKECAQKILEMQGKNTDAESVLELFNEVRKKTTKLIKCDASLPYPLEFQEGQYPLIITNFCADSATGSKKIWDSYMGNIYNLLEEEGYILISALRECTQYKVGKEFFPSANLTENDMYYHLISHGFSKKNINISIALVPECASEGFSSLIFAIARK